MPPVLTYLIGIAMKTVSEKIRNRIKFYKSFDDETFDVIDKKSLPKEYGGTVELKEMSSKFILNCAKLMVRGPVLGKIRDAY